LQDSEGEEEESENDYSAEHNGGEESNELQGSDEGSQVEAHASQSEHPLKIAHDDTQAENHASELEHRHETIQDDTGRTRSKRGPKRTDHRKDDKSATHKTDTHKKPGKTKALEHEPKGTDHRKEGHKDDKSAAPPKKQKKTKAGAKAKKHGDDTHPSLWGPAEQQGVSTAAPLSNAGKLWRTASFGVRASLVPAKDATGMFLQAVGNITKMLRGFASGDASAAEALCALLEAQAAASEQQQEAVAKAQQKAKLAEVRLPPKELPELGHEVDVAPLPSPPYVATLVNSKFNREVKAVLIRIMVDGGILANDSEETLYNLLRESSLVSEDKPLKDTTAQDYAEHLRSEFIDPGTVTNRLTRKAVKLAAQIAGGSDDAARKLLAAEQGCFSSEEEEDEDEEAPAVEQTENSIQLELPASVRRRRCSHERLPVKREGGLVGGWGARGAHTRTLSVRSVHVCAHVD
jgi:hypothetical protein